jgi:hypothetical protein
MQKEFLNARRTGYDRGVLVSARRVSELRKAFREGGK